MKEMKITPPEGYVIDEKKSTVYNIVFKKKKKNELPVTWEEFCTNYPKQKEETYIEVSSHLCTIQKPGVSRIIDIDRNLLPSKEAAKAHRALMQLHQLRDVYRQGWVPDYKVLNTKYVIKSLSNNDLHVLKTTIQGDFLVFQSEEIAEQFLENFEDLIMEAKELI